MFDVRKRLNLRLRDRLRGLVADTPELHEIAMRLTSRQRIFQRAYRERSWGSDESGSGLGSELAATTNIRPWLPHLFQEHGVRSVLDAPCGDWNWMRQVELAGIDYTGVDLVPEVIAANINAYTRPGVRFAIADLTRDRLPMTDLILCRDCWIHLSFADIDLMLENFRRSGATWLLTTDAPDVTRNRNQITGLPWRPLNLRLPPFGFPEPVEARVDNLPEAPLRLCLWRLQDLPRLSS